MYSKHHTPNQVTLVTRLQADLARMQNDSTCTYDTVGNWIKDNANIVSKAFTGNTGKKLAKYETVTLFGVNEYEDKIVLSVSGSWKYLGNNGGPPDTRNLVEAVSPFITFETRSYTSMDTCVWGTMEFELNAWPNLIPVALTYFLKNASSPNRSDFARDSDEQNISVLLKTFFPRVSYDFLLTAVDLGILERGDQDFIAWLKLNAGQHDASKSVLPGNFF